MSDFIDRQATIEVINNHIFYDDYDDMDKIDLINAIGALPLAEKRGRWEEHPYEREWDICSCCKTGTKRREFGVTDDGREWVTEESYTYCPWCGAKME